MGYYFNDEMREKLVEATKEYEQDKSKRTKLNAIIMEIQKPLKDKLDAIQVVLNKH